MRRLLASGPVFFCVIVGLGVLGTVIGVKLAGGVSASDLQQRLIESCTVTRVPLHDYFSDQLAESESHSIAYYRERFPDFPTDELRAAITKQRRNLRALVDTFDPGTCADAYR